MPVRLNSLHPEVLSRLIGLPREQFHVAKPAAQNFQFLSKSLETHRLHTTILSALQEVKAVGGYADIIVWPGQYKESATIDITNDSTRLLAAEMPPFGGSLVRTEIRQYGNVDTPCVSVEGAHNVEIGGFRITPYDPGTNSVAINVSQVAASYGVYIHDNYFYGVASGATGPCSVQLGVIDSFNADSALIYRNKFYLGTASNDSVGQLMWNMAVRAEVRNNHFWMHGNVATAHCIKIDDAAGMRGGIFDNRFMNIEIALKGSNAVAISNPTAAGGGVQIDGNVFINFAANAQCIADLDDETLGVNYKNETLIASAT